MHCPIPQNYESEDHREPGTSPDPQPSETSNGQPGNDDGCQKRPGMLTERDAGLAVQ